MSVGFLYDGMWPLREYLEVAQIADEAGLDSIWIAEHFMHRDAMICSAYTLEHTKQIRVVPGPISPYPKHPLTIAMGALSVAEGANARFGLHLGTGNSVTQSTFGVEVNDPLHIMKKAYEIIRALCNGETVSTPDGPWIFDRVKMRFDTPLKFPLYLAAIRPKMLQLANRLSDGIVLSAAISPAFIRYSLDQIRPEEDDTLFIRKPVIGFIIASVGETRIDAYNQIRPTLAYMLRTPFMRKDWELNDLQIDHAAIFAAFMNNDVQKASSLIDDRVIEALTICGSRKDFERRLYTYKEAGVDLPVLLPIGNLEDKKRTLRLAAHIVG